MKLFSSAEDLEQGLLTVGTVKTLFSSMDDTVAWASKQAFLRSTL